MKIYALEWFGVDEWSINGLFKTRKEAEANKGYDEEVTVYDMGKRFCEKHKPSKPHKKGCKCLGCHFGTMMLKNLMDSSVLNTLVKNPKGTTVRWARFTNIGLKG